MINRIDMTMVNRANNNFKYYVMEYTSNAWDGQPDVKILHGRMLDYDPDTGVFVPKYERELWASETSKPPRRTEDSMQVWMMNQRDKKVDKRGYEIVAEISGRDSGVRISEVIETVEVIVQRRLLKITGKVSKKKRNSLTDNTVQDRLNSIN